jgi:LacI family transcriptional regulator
VAYRCHQLLQKKGYEMITGEFGPALLDPSHGMGLTRLDVDGVLMYGGNLGCLKPILESNFPMKAPIVNMGLHCVGSLDYVNIDLYSASRQGVEYLVRTGRKRIAHMLPEYTRNRADSRYCAYEDVLAESGMTPEYVIIQGWSSFDARESIKEYVNENGVPDGLFCANDEIAIGTYRGLRDLGVRIPDECALLGCDGINDLEFLDPPISTIAQPMEEMIATAWSFLQNRMASPNCPQQTKSLEASFVVRT